MPLAVHTVALVFIILKKEILTVQDVEHKVDVLSGENASYTLVLKKRKSNIVDYVTSFLLNSSSINTTQNMDKRVPSLEQDS